MESDLEDIKRLNSQEFLGEPKSDLLNTAELSEHSGSHHTRLLWKQAERGAKSGRIDLKFD